MSRKLVVGLFLPKRYKVITEDIRKDDMDLLIYPDISPEKIAAAIVFLASDEASYITGTTLCVESGCVGFPIKPARFWVFDRFLVWIISANFLAMVNLDPHDIHCGFLI